MTSQNEKKLSADSLRNKLFSKKSVHDLSNIHLSDLKFGVELEYLVESTIENNPKLMNRVSFEKFLDEMVLLGFERIKNLPDKHRIGKDFSNGFVAIKPDYAFHILEIAFLPINNFNDFKAIYTDIITDVDFVLKKLGFERSHKSYIYPIDEKLVEYVNLNRLQGYSDVVNDYHSKMGTKNSFCDPNFPASIVSTHVHINFNDESYIKLLPLMYELETLSCDFFNICSGTFHGKEIKNLRAMLYKNTLGKDYELTFVPKHIPKTLDDYLTLYNTGPRLFTKDPFFPVRDLCYIRFTGYGTIEFRSACTLFEIDKILKLMAFRYAQILYAIKYKDNLIEDSSWIHEYLFDHAQNNTSIHESKKQKVKERFLALINENNLLNKVGLRELL